VASYKRIDGKTPSGGAYSEIHFFDENGNTSDEKDAVRFVIRECKADGTLLGETWGIKPKKHLI
jgi:hypothetical protein